MTEFVSKNNFFELNNQIKQWISGTAVGTTCALMYACVLIDTVEKELLKTQRNKPFWWVDNILFIWMHGQEKLKSIYKILINFTLI